MCIITSTIHCGGSSEGISLPSEKKIDFLCSRGFDPRIKSEYCEIGISYIDTSIHPSQKKKSLYHKGKSVSHRWNRFLCRKSTQMNRVPLWWSEYNTSHVLYNFIGVLNRCRKANTVGNGVLKHMKRSSKNMLPTPLSTTTHIDILMCLPCFVWVGTQLHFRGSYRLL